MAEEQIGTRKDYLKELAPWTKIFVAFKIALDPKKLVLAGGGLLVMALGWYVLSVIFFSISSRPDEKNYPDLKNTDAVKREAAWKEYKRDRDQWNLLYEMAGTPTWAEEVVGGKKVLVPKERMDIADLANTFEDFERLRADLGKIKTPDEIAKLKALETSLKPDEALKAKADLAAAITAAEFAKLHPAAAILMRMPEYLPYGRFRILPWFEERGPNPYLLVTGNTKATEARSDGLIGWFFHDQLPVLLEPLFKFYQPIVYLFKPEAGFWNRIYLFLVILWSLATWAFFGGAITRIVAVQVARTNERISLKEAVKFVIARYRSFLTAPVLPLLFLAVLTIVLIIFGVAEGNLWIAGDILGPLLWPLVLLAGLIMAVVLVGLIGWPLMYTTISAEGSDSFDAISRSYSYVYQAPWHYLWYSFVALVYGAVLVFFVGLMGSLMVYTSKWSISLAPTAEEREPSYLYRWAPTSFGWRDLLLNKSPHAELRETVNSLGQRQLVTECKVDTPPYVATWNNNVASFIVSIWLYLLFLMIVGFGYSYFWTASTIIYLLMRLKVDDTEMDEIHLEEEPEQPFPSPAMSTPVAGAEMPKTNQSPLQMVETPQLRGSSPGAATPVQTSPSAPASSSEPSPLPPRTDGPTQAGGM